jgi:tetratricopeptide (TPR) repeat protein
MSVCTALLLAALLHPLLPRAAGAHQDLADVLAAHERESDRRGSDPAGHLEEANLRRQARDFDGALVSVERAATLGADPGDVAIVRGQVYLDAGWPGAARAEVDRALRTHPERFHVRLTRARASHRLGELTAAAADYRTALAGMRSPTPDHVVEYRDVLLEAGDTAGALAALDLGMTRIGPVPTLQLPAIDLALALGRDADALRRIDALLAQNPRNERWLARRGEILQRSGRTNEAKHTYTVALALIEARPAGRRGGRVRALEQRLRAHLASTTKEKDMP